MSIRRTLLNLFRSLFLGGAIDHPSNGGMTGEHHAEDGADDDDHTDEESP